MVMQLKKRTTLILVLVITAFLFLAACKDKSADDGLTDDAEDGEETVPNDVKIDVNGEDTPPEDATNETTETTDEIADVVEEQPPLTDKDQAASKISKLDDPLDEIEDILEDLTDEVERGTAKFSQIKYNQLNVALLKDLKKLNSDISVLTNMLYDSDIPDFTLITEEYYRINDAVKVFYEQASKDLEALQGTTQSSSSSSTSSTNINSTTTTTTPAVELSNDCTDPDGLNFNVKGTASGVYYTGSAGPQIFEDKCAGLNNEKAYDYYCENNKVRFQLMTCTNGCQDGKCA